MFTSLNNDRCPTEDILSVYIDNELPTKYLAQVTTHIEHCPLCKARLESLRSVKDVFLSDDKLVMEEVATDDFVDSSFARLQTKMHYERNTKRAFRSQSHWAATSAKFLVAAAAFVLALTVPLVTLSKKADTSSTVVARNTYEQFNPIKRPRLPEGSQGIQNAAFGGGRSLVYPASQGNANENFALESAIEDAIPDVDVFKPNFNSDTINMDFSIDMWYNGRKVARQSFGVPIKKEYAKSFIHKLPHP